MTKVETSSYILLEFFVILKGKILLLRSICKFCTILIFNLITFFKYIFTNIKNSFKLINLLIKNSKNRLANYCKLKAIF